MSDKVINQPDMVINSCPLDIQDENSGFKSALLIKSSFQCVDHHGQDFLESSENINLCSDSFLSETKKKSSDSKLCELNFKNCISSDLLKRLEESSPIKSNKNFKIDRPDINYMTNYTDRNENDIEEEEDYTRNHKNMFRDSHSLFYPGNNAIKDVEKLYLMEDNMEYESEEIPSDHFAENFFNNRKVIGGFSDLLKHNRKSAPTKPLDGYGRTARMENIFQDQTQNFGNPFQNYFMKDKDIPKKENIGNFVKNNLQFKNNYVAHENLHQKYGFPDEDKTITNMSPDIKRFYHLDENVAFYPKNYNPGFSVTPTGNRFRFRELEDPTNLKNNYQNLFDDFSFSQSVNDLFKNKVKIAENNQNSDDSKFNSLIFPEDSRKEATDQNTKKISQKEIPDKVIISAKETNIPLKNPVFPMINSKKMPSQNQTTTVNAYPTNIQTNKNSQCVIKENSNAIKPNQNANSKSCLNGKSGWICNNCKNFNYESKYYFKNNLARIKCNRCGRPQITNLTQEKESNSNYNTQEKSVHSTTSNKSVMNNNCSNSANMIYNKNPKYASNQYKNSYQGLNKIENIKKKSPLNETNKSEKFNEIIENTKDLASPEISTKANSTDSKKKKKPFVERLGDWVCIKCKNLNFSFRVVCNRCQLTKVESENLFEQYMKNLMNYVKLNEILQNQIFSNSNINNLLDINGINNQLIININKNIQQKKLQIPNETNILNYLNDKCLNSNEFSPKTNFSTEGSNSNLGICENYYTEDSRGDNLGNKSK